jgi:hypothetical protein
MTQKVLLDFSNTKSVEDSVLRSFNNKYPDLVSWVKQIQIPDGVYCHEREDYIFDLVCDQFGYPVGKYEAVWFHATRVANKNSFLKDGILPKSKIHEVIVSCLESLSEGLTRGEGEVDTISSSAKQKKENEGPFAALFKEVAFYPTGHNGNYFEVPEIIKDIADKLLGSNSFQLINRFKESSIPCVVSFKGDADIKKLSKGLLYLNLMGRGCSENDAANQANEYLDADGQIIQPENIINIENIISDYF